MIWTLFLSSLTILTWPSSVPGELEISVCSAAMTSYSGDWQVWRWSSMSALPHSQTDGLADCCGSMRPPYHWSCLCWTGYNLIMTWTWSRTWKPTWCSGAGDTRRGQAVIGTGSLGLGRGTISWRCTWPADIQTCQVSRVACRVSRLTWGRCRSAQSTTACRTRAGGWPRSPSSSPRRTWAWEIL